MSIDIALYQQWIGKTEQVTDILNPYPANALAATLDLPMRFELQQPLPKLWHWLYFLNLVPSKQLGIDGHIARGGFLPPISLPRRMWAGGRLTFDQPMRIGDQICRHSEIAAVNHKAGKTGDLIFVTLKHTYLRGDDALLTEEQELVYREAVSANSAPTLAVPDSVHARTIIPDPVMLFRYSALTFNSHRIHFDRTYATNVEGYPGLVVHGPLIATLLMQLISSHEPHADIKSFSFRAVRPLFDISPFKVYLKTEQSHYQLWAADELGALAMTASAETRK